MHRVSHAELENRTSFKRGIRLLNGRKQVLLQDAIYAQGTIMWRMHTNATVNVSGTSATLKIGDQTVQMSILNPPSGVTVTTGPAQRFDDDPPLPAGQVDQPNPGEERIYRTYRIFIAGTPVILITESFPLALYACA